MTSTTTSMTGTTTGTAAASCTPFYQIPIQDAACAVNVKGNSSDIMKQCCEPAAVMTYHDGCNAYCRAQQQNVEDLSRCLRGKGIEGTVFCNKQDNATATAPLTGTNSGATSTGTSTGTSTSSSTSGSGASETSQGAAVVNQPAASKSGLGLLAMVVCSGLMGVLA